MVINMTLEQVEMLVKKLVCLSLIKAEMGITWQQH